MPARNRSASSSGRSFQFENGWELFPAVFFVPAQGRLEKYFKESVRTEPEFVKDSSLTIGQLAKNVSKSLGDDVEVMSFVRYTFGE